MIHSMSRLAAKYALRLGRKPLNIVYESAHAAASGPSREERGEARHVRDRTGAVADMGINIPRGKKLLVWQSKCLYLTKNLSLNSY